MGKTYSYLPYEKETWSDHCIKFDEGVRNMNLKTIDSFEDGKEIYLCHRPIQIGGLTFQHWFVTDKNLFFEFSSPDSQIYSAKVHIVSVGPSTFVIDKCTKPMDNEVRDRMRHVVGMSNYSLCLRNCEHVANYVFRGGWISHQMNFEGVLFDYFHSKLKNSNPNALKQVNSFPSSPRPDIISEGRGKQIYSFLNEHYTATSIDYYLDHRQGTYNILVFGPTGADKSNVIDVFFNQPVCDSGGPNDRGARDITFIRGRGDLIEYGTNRHRNREVAVADVAGLCDAEWDDEEIIKRIRGRVSANIPSIDAVFIVFPAGILSRQHISSIKAIMNWLGYQKGDRYLNFLFVCTNAKSLSEQNKLDLRKKIIKTFNLKTGTGNDLIERLIPAKYHEKDLVTMLRMICGKPRVESICESDPLIYVEFPPEDQLTEEAKEDVRKSLKLLQSLLLHPRKKSIPTNK